MSFIVSISGVGDVNKQHQQQQPQPGRYGNAHLQMTANYLARRHRIVIIRRVCTIFIILLGVFTMAWASTIHAPRYRQTAASRKQQTMPFDGIHNLIIIPGHSIQRCSSVGDLEHDVGKCWFLLDYQQGQHRLFLEHIKTGLRRHNQDPHSMLVFSGGQTRKQMGRVSEAQSYHDAAVLLKQARGRPFSTDRWVLEEYARDSFENVAFSLCRYKQLTGRWPAKVTVVGFPFKERRFRQLHWPTIAKHIPEPVQFEYVSVTLSGHDQSGLVDDAYPLFERDPLGETGVLAEKRKQRNPFGQQHPYDCLPFSVFN